MMKTNLLKKGHVEVRKEKLVSFQVLELGSEGLWWSLGQPNSSRKAVDNFWRALPASRYGRRLSKVEITTTRRTEILKEEVK